MNDDHFHYNNEKEAERPSNKTKDNAIQESRQPFTSNQEHLFFKMPKLPYYQVPILDPADMELATEDLTPLHLPVASQTRLIESGPHKPINQ